MLIRKENMKVSYKGTGGEDLKHAFQNARGVFIAQTIAQVIIFLASGTAIFLAQIWGYWGIEIVFACIMGLTVIKMLRI